MMQSSDDYHDDNADDDDYLWMILWMKRMYQALSALKVPNKDEKEKSWEVMVLITEIYIKNARARLRG